MDTDSPLTVVIISPTHSPHRFTLDLASKSTILHLKDLIALRLQDGADALLTATDQRLIYGGRILEDSETLDGIFEKVDCSNAPTIHLVVSQRHVSGCGQQQQQQQRTSAPGTPSPLRFRMQSGREHSASTGSSNHNGNISISSNTAATSTTNLNPSSLFTPMTRSSSEPLSALPFQATVSGTATSAPAHPKQASATPVPQFAPSLLPLQHVLVNGMPYLVPAAYMPMLHLQQHIQLNALNPYLGPSMAINVEGTTYYQHIPAHYMANFMPGTGANQGAAGAGPAHLGHGNGHGLAAAQVVGQAGGAAAVAAGGRELNARDLAVRDQRRAASLWLFLKLAFGVYLFSQNGSIERIVLLNIAALIIFLHQTGRLRIVRRIVHQPGDQAQAGYIPVAPGGTAPPPPQAAATAPPQHQTTTTSTTTTSTSSSSSSFTPSATASSEDSELNENINNSSTSHVGSSSANTASGSDTQFSSSTSSSSSSSSPFSKTANISQSNNGSTLSANGHVQATTEGANTEQQQQQQQHPEQQQQQPQMSTWRSIEYALLTFITSLVPAPPPELDPAAPNAAAAGDRGM